MNTEFDMEKGFEIVDDKIIIDSTPAFSSLYSISKKTVAACSKEIDRFVKMINGCDKYIATIEEIDSKESENKMLSELLSLKEMLNLQCLIMSCDIDISISVRELALSKNRPEQVYFIKQIYIGWYRYLERINSDLKLFKDLASRYGFETEYKDAFKNLKNFEKKHYKAKIKDRRNKLYAHITDSKDFREYHTHMTSLNIDEESNICVEFMSVNKVIVELLTKISMPIVNMIDQISLSSVKKYEDQMVTAYSNLEKIKNSHPKEYTRIKEDLNDIVKKHPC